MHAPVLVTPPALTPITRAEAKLHCKIEDDLEDGLVDTLIDAAVQALDGYSGILGRALITQTWRQDFDGFCRTLRLPLQASALTSVKWTDTSAVETTIDPAYYAPLQDGLGSYVRFVDAFAAPGNLAEAAAVKVTFTAGFGAAAADVPAPIRQAMLLMVGTWYRNREAVVTGTIATALPMSAEWLLAPFRRVGV